MLRLLCFTAHPDDEAGGFGGTLRKYSEQGVETHVICLTAGTAATHRGKANSNEELAALRKAEFAAACELLKVSHSEVLDYPDGGLSGLNPLPIVGHLTRCVRQIRPHVLITFGSEGAVTAHPDHSMVSVFASLAFQWAARTNRFPEQLEHEGLKIWRAQKLYYATASFTMPERQPVALGPWTADIELTAQQLEAKIAAFKRHTTQAPLFDFFDRTMHERGNIERFHLAAAVQPQPARYETDLFAGVSA